MKTKNICAAILFSIISLNSFAQSTIKEIIRVSGNCGICKKNIEKAAKAGGASTADWNVQTKVLYVDYDSAKSNSEQIQRAIAVAGYDTEGFKADNNAYNNLMACCKYDRNTALTKKEN